MDLSILYNELGDIVIDAQETVPDPSWLIKRINKMHPTLQLLEHNNGDVIIEEITKTSAAIKATESSDRVKGSGKLLFNAKVDLDTINFNRWQGNPLLLGTRIPSAKDLTQAIIEDNPKHEFIYGEDKDIWFPVIGKKDTTVYAGNKKRYHGHKELIYLVKIDLKKINNILGVVESTGDIPRENDLLDAVYAKNSEIGDENTFKDNVRLKNITKSSAIIYVLIPSNDYIKSEIKLEYTYKQLNKN